VHQRVHKFPAFYETRILTTAFKRVSPLLFTLGQMSPIHTLLSHFFQINSILCSNKCLCLPRGLFLSCFRTKTLGAFLSSSLLATRPTRLTLIDFISRAIFGEGPASWPGGQDSCLLDMRSRVRFPVLPWEFSLIGDDPNGGLGLGSL
jgi:hypothetical protein